MKRFIRISRLAVVLMVSAAVCGIAAASGNDSTRRQKARHFFISGAIKEAEQKPDAAYELYKKAYRTDTTYADAAMYYGWTRFYVNSDTLSSRPETLRSLSLAQTLVDRFPGDEAVVMQYAYFAGFADTIEESVRVLRNLDSVRPNNPTTLMNLASVYADAGNIDSALSAVRKVERLEGVSFQTTLSKVRFHLMNADTTSVVSELTALMQENPGSAEYALVKGKVLSMLGMQDSALVYMDMARNLDPDDGRIVNELAQVYAARGDSVRYDAMTYEALLSDNLQFEVKMEILRTYIGALLSDNADRARGDRLFEVLSHQYPHEPSLLGLAARYASSCGDYDTAIEKVSYAIDLDPTSQEYRQMLMSYYILAGRPDDALAVYEKAVADIAEPQGTDLDDLFIAAAVSGKRYDRVFPMLDRMLRRICPSMSVTDSTVNLSRLHSLNIYNLYLVSEYFQQAGDIFYQLDSIPEAFRAYENAIAVFPDNLMALNNYAYFIVEKGGHRPGSALFDRALEMSRKTIDETSGSPNPTYLDTYAWILHLAGRDEEALEYLTKGIAVNDASGEDGAEYHLHLGDILLSLGRGEEAAAEWRKALELEPDNTEALSRLKK